MGFENVLASTQNPIVACSSFLKTVAIMTAKNLPYLLKIKPFNGDHFKRWQEKIYDIVDGYNLANYLKLSPLKQGYGDYKKKMKTWTKNNRVYRYIILNALCSNLYDIPYKIASEKWD